MTDDSYLTDGVDELEAPVCPSCKGQCYERNGDPCDVCFGEGVLDIPTW